MTIATNELRNAIRRLHAYLVAAHWNGHALRGPDSGVRFNARIGRFIKSYLPSVSWGDDYVYLQAQGYWILDNWLQRDLLNDAEAESIALTCAEYVLACQRPGGYWEYANPEWKGRVATVEGDFAALGLLETYRHTGDQRLLDGALRWHRYLTDVVGFQGSNGELAINYFANRVGAMVPNNTALTLRTFATLADVTGDTGYLSPARAMVAWLRRVQVATGELPYALDPAGEHSRPHFLCYQYNAFELLDLAEYSRLSGDEEVRPIMESLARFLARGITDSGAARYDCHQAGPEMPYYTAVLGAALSRATHLGLGDYARFSDRAYRRVLDIQRPDGGMAFFSSGNYRWLADTRSYPRNLSMILCHLLFELRAHRASPSDLGTAPQKAVA